MRTLPNNRVSRLSFSLFATLVLGCGSSSSSGATAPSGTGGSSAGGSSAGSGGAGAAGAGGGVAAGTGGAGGTIGGAGGVGGSGGASATGGGGGGGGKAGAGGKGGSGGNAGSGGAAGTDNESFDTAAPLLFDDGGGANAVTTTLPLGDVDYYKFTGKKGDAIHVSTQAKPPVMPFDTSYNDLVMTVYDQGKQQIANADDSYDGTSNDPEIYTVLPADGAYYIRIQECNTWDKGGAMNCSPPSMIKTFDYSISMIKLDVASPFVVGDAEPNDTAAKATKLKYAKSAMGGYGQTVIVGAFEAATDVDVYLVNLPADTMVGAGTRPVAYFSWLPNGPDFDGSTTQMGEVSLVDPTDPMNAVAKIADGAIAKELSPPVTLGKDYYLYVKRGAMTGANDFYFGLHFGGSGNPLEKETTAGQNDTLATAETLVAMPAGAAEAFYVEGDISTTSDVDFFSLPFTAGKNMVQAVCGAEASGSGIREMTVSLVQADGAAIPKGTASDSFDKNAQIAMTAIPAGQTSLRLKIAAPTRDATIASTFYRCGVYFTTM